MDQRLCTHLELLYPDTSRKVIEKQDKLATVTKQCRKFEVGNQLYSRNSRGPNKWIARHCKKYFGSCVISNTNFIWLHSMPSC